MASFPPVIAWDYQFAPNAQKSRNYLYAAQIPFKICEQSFFAPRQILCSIGITYRRIPVLSIGKDFFCDNSIFISAMQSLAEKAGGGLKRHSFDRAFEGWGYRSFWVILPCVPEEFLTERLKDDRKALFPVFAREDYSSAHASAASELRALMTTVENEFLSTTDGPWIAGSQCGLADIHAMWMIKWSLKTIEMEKKPGFGKDAFPKVHRWYVQSKINIKYEAELIGPLRIEGIPHHDEALEKDHKLSPEQATEQALASDYALPEIGVDKSDPMQLKGGEQVQVEAMDVEPNSNPQHGVLIGLDSNEIVLQLDSGVRLHFPRVGYLIKKSTGEGISDS